MSMPEARALTIDLTLCCERVQIVWDNPAVPFDFPGDFFDKTVTFGINFKAKGGSFAVSNPATPPPEDDRFSSILPVAQARTFKTFSAPRLFTPIKGNKVFVDFKVPGSDIAAGVTGYGAMFVDVDEARKTSMKYFDRNGCLIARVEAQALDKGLSFAGITVLDPRNPGKLLPVIARVEMKLGDISVERFTNTWTGRERTDLVVVDDLLYGEPQAL